jgi:hypothetical protein
MKGIASSRHPGAQPNGAVVLLGALSVVVISLLFYLKTLAPTVLYYDPTAFPDSVVLQIQAIVLGIPHTTGYPTWVMLSHLFTYLPVGDPAYRANLSSAVYAAAAVLLVYLLCLRFTRRAVPSCVAALLFGLSRDFWSQAVITEVYTLNALFVALVIFLLLLWRDTRDDRHLLLACFSMGLSLTNHLTSGLLVPAGVLFVGLVDRRKLRDLRLTLKGAESLARRVPAKLGMAALIGVTAAVLVLPFGGIGQRYKAVDQSQDYVGQRTIECVAHKTQRGATVLQHRSLLNYMTLVEGRRRDLDIVEVFGPGTWTARSDLWVKKSQRHLAKGAVYILFPVVDIERLNAPSFEAAGYRLIPEGCEAFYEVARER